MTLTTKVPVREFKVPRFTMSYNTKAAATLRDLGLTLPFDPVRADFGDMLEAAPEPLFVSEVYHECFVKVDEEGRRRRQGLCPLAPVSAGGGFCRRPPVRVPDPGGVQRRGGFRRASDQPFGFALNYDLENDTMNGQSLRVHSCNFVIGLSMLLRCCMKM